jgi:hypothetical protein
VRTVCAGASLLVIGRHIRVAGRLTTRTDGVPTACAGDAGEVQIQLAALDMSTPGSYPLTRLRSGIWGAWLAAAFRSLTCGRKRNVAWRSRAATGGEPSLTGVGCRVSSRSGGVVGGVDAGLVRCNGASTDSSARCRYHVQGELLVGTIIITPGPSWRGSANRSDPASGNETSNRQSPAHAAQP